MKNFNSGEIAIHWACAIAHRHPFVRHHAAASNRSGRFCRAWGGAWRGAPPAECGGVVQIGVAELELAQANWRGLSSYRATTGLAAATLPCHLLWPEKSRRTALFLHKGHMSMSVPALRSRHPWVGEVMTRQNQQCGRDPTARTKLCRCGQYPWRAKAGPAQLLGIGGDVLIRHFPAPCRRC